MATVQRRDRQNIHESKDDRQESCHVPELVPVPCSRKDTADRSETAQLLRSFFREQVFHIAHIAFQRFHTKRDACRERLAELCDGVFPELFEKNVDEKGTTTRIRGLSYEESVEELARMLGGAKITEAVLQNAAEMKDLAQQQKNTRLK